MKKILLFLLLSLNLQSFGQNAAIKKAYAFSSPVVYGNAPADSNDKKPENNFLVYVEISSSTILKIATAWIGNISYTVNSTTIKEKIVNVGESISGKKIKISTPKGNKILLLEFSPDDKQKKIPATSKNRKAGTIILELMYKNKKSYYSTPSIIQLKTDLSVL